MSTSSGKDTIYIDIDDEITTIIDKVRGSHEKIVALVLPKRATVLQSIVNMKLLKRTADEAKKHLVLITSEAGLLPLAGSVGIYVAKSLQSRPEVPVTHMGAHGADDDDEEAVSLADDEPLDDAKPVGEHLRRSPSVAALPAIDEDDTINLDSATLEAESAAMSKKTKPKKGGKKFSIPDFNKFRIWAVIGGIAVVVFVFMWYMAFVAMPRASISVKTDSSAVQANLDLSLSSAAREVDAEKALVPSVEQKAQKTFTQQVEATGQKDNGTKATGTASMTGGTCAATPPNDVPAGTGLSANGLTYIAQSNTTFVPKLSGGKCTWVATAATSVAAQNNGDKYNTGPTALTVAGRPDISASTSGVSGGTSQIVKIVSQADIDNAKQKVATGENDALKQELQSGLTAKSLYPIDDTFKAGEPEVSTDVKVGDEAANVTVTQKIIYTMLGVKQADLKKVIDKAVEDKIDENKQQITDYGLDKATFKFQNENSGVTLVTMEATAIAGSDLNVGEIKTKVAGKKTNDARTIINEYPGVTEVKVDYSPFWVSSIPKKTAKITVTVEKPVVQKNAN